jgi:hypothetical protein
MSERIEVIVGNVGTVYDGYDRCAADLAFNEYVKLSKSGVGRAGDETVAMIVGNDIAQEYIGPIDKAEYID